VALYMDRNFVLGLVVGVGGVWAWHRFVKPMPSKANG
jgi:hypothetical protein